MYNSEKTKKKQKTNMKKLFKKHNPPKNGQFPKAREHNNQILISIVTS